MAIIVTQKSIRKRLYVIVASMAVLICLEIFVLWFTVNCLSAVRGLMEGGSQWAYSQKNATYSLTRYLLFHKAIDYKDYQENMEMPLREKENYIELMKPEFNYQLVYERMLADDPEHPQDIDVIIKLIRNFRNNRYFKPILDIWSQGNGLIDQLSETALEIKLLTEENRITPSDVERLSNKLSSINNHATAFELDYSYSLSDNARTLENLVINILIVLALTVIISTVIMVMAINKRISKSLSSITKAADEVIAGNYLARAEIIEYDELGHIAMVFNTLTTRIGNNLEEVKAGEEALQVALEEVNESNKELQHFAYVISHDLKSPLRGMSSLAYFLKEDYYDKLDEQGREYIDAIILRAQNLNNMVDGILEYSRTTGVKQDLEVINVNELITSTINTFSPPKKVAFNIGEHLPNVPYERIKLQQVFQNLISNAINYADKDICTITISATEDEKSYVFCVEDNGSGIEERDFERIFNIHQIVDESGQATLRIGLAIVKKIIDNSGGKIWLWSEMGTGAKFYFTIPK